MLMSHTWIKDFERSGYGASLRVSWHILPLVILLSSVLTPVHGEDKELVSIKIITYDDNEKTEKNTKG